MSKRPVFQRFNADVEHQRIAGGASWSAFSARWRARQGLPLLHAMDVQYLTPQDFCNGLGHRLPPAEQRRVFRRYVEAALQCYIATGARLAGRRRDLPLSADIAFMRAEGFERALRLRRDFVYGGREDVRRYEAEALLPTRPYGIPISSATFPSYWQAMREAEDDENGDESWIGADGEADVPDEESEDFPW